MGVLHATRAALPSMLERGNGHIVKVSSTSGRVASPLFSVYSATKYGLGAFTEVLRKEVQPNRIRVTPFEPGPTESELGSHVEPEILRSLREDALSDVKFLKAEDVTQGILWTLIQPDRINVNEVLFSAPRTSGTGYGPLSTESPTPVVCTLTISSSSLAVWDNFLPSTKYR